MMLEHSVYLPFLLFSDSVLIFEFTVYFVYGKVN